MNNGNNKLIAIISAGAATLVTFVLLATFVLPTITIISSTGIGTLVLFIFVVLLIFLIGKAEDRKRAFILFKGGIMKRLNAIFPWVKNMRDAPEGREPQVLIENKHIIHANVNYTTRAEITYRYWNVVKEGVKSGEKIMPLISVFTDPVKLRRDIIVWRNGDGNQETSDGQKPIGWNRYNLDVVKLINDYMKLTAMVHLSSEYKLKPTTAFKPDAVQFEILETHARELSREIHESYEKYKFRAEAYKAHHILRTFKGVILTMSNVTGDVLENPQIFARPDAEFAPSEMGGRIIAGKEVIEGFEMPTHEVNQYGEYVEDINIQKDRFGNLPPPYGAHGYRKPRRLTSMKDVMDYPHFLNLMKNIELDWRNLAWDIRYGFYHKKSRTAQDYLDALKKNKYPEWADNEIKMQYGVSFTNQALDLRALANPGLNLYWGRKNFYDEQPPDKNPYPGISSIGLGRFLRSRIEGDIRNKGRAHQYMEKIPADTGAFEKVTEMIEGKKVVTKKIGGRLSEIQK